jgi:predicted transcriptional regulator
MNIDKIKEAYSTRDDAALLKALKEFRHLLSNGVYSVGPAAMALQLRGTHLPGILNKTEAEAEGKPGGSLALVVGHLSAYTNYVELIADRERVDLAVALLSDLRDQGEQANLVRRTILKSVLTHCGVRPKELVDVVTRYAKVKQSLAKRHIRDLFEMGLIEQIKVYETLKALKAHREVVHYRISHLGEAVLMRLMRPHELVLRYIDEAAFNAELRAAMRNEIKYAWPLEDLTVSDEELRAIAAKRDEIKRKWSSV